MHGGITFVDQIVVPEEWKEHYRMSRDSLYSLAHTLLGTLSHFHRFSLFGVDRRKRFEYATCGRVFFENGEEKSPFSKISGYVWTEPKSVVQAVFL